ncbi:hypothetical protein [Kineococcus indalonis]|uniref:hypothetical protein n=1 Tax=Kineococcus indalonis TaxID=2696566 RepID=UPI001412A227|nr:hypothetical protein [Kineococcus indalonis]NAZ87436.1 hypothetical protein [Kineococcus indalonis]
MVRRCLVVANQSLRGEALERAVRQRLEQGEHEFHVVVPATPLREQVLGPGTSPAEAALALPEHSYAVAQQRLDAALARIEALGASVSGEVGDADVVAAARLALTRFAAEEIVVSTLPAGLSRWLRGDVPSKLARATGLPVTHVTGGARRH